MSTTPIARWPAPWIRAAMPTVILLCLEDGPMHGYAIATALADRGFGKPKGGSLYPALGKLEQEGAVNTQWVEGAAGPGRREYTLTERGRRRLDDERTAWSELAAVLGGAGHSIAETSVTRRS